MLKAHIVSVNSILYLHLFLNLFCCCEKFLHAKKNRVYLTLVNVKEYAVFTKTTYRKF